MPSSLPLYGPRKLVCLFFSSYFLSKCLSVNISFLGSDGHAGDAGWAAGGEWDGTEQWKVHRCKGYEGTGCCTPVSNVLQRTKSRFKTVVLTSCWQNHPDSVSEMFASDNHVCTFEELLKHRHGFQTKCCRYCRSEFTNMFWGACLHWKLSGMWLVAGWCPCWADHTRLCAKWHTSAECLKMPIDKSMLFSLKVLMQKKNESTNTNWKKCHTF